MNDLHGQFSMEGILAGFMFCMGAAGFIILDRTNSKEMKKIHRVILMSIGITFVIISYFSLRVFISTKLP